MAFSSSLSFKSKVFLITILNLLSVFVIISLVFIPTNALISGILIIYTLIVGALSVSFLTKFSKTFDVLINITKLSKSLSEGKIEKVKLIDIEEEEIKTLVHSTTEISNAYTNIITLATEIGKNNFNFEYQPKSIEDELGRSMIAMKDNLKLIAEKDAQQNWITAGLAKFGDLLRTENQTIETLSLSIVSNLCKYIGANQGGLFVLNEEQKGHEHLALKAYFAYDKQKFIEKTVKLEKEKGEYIFGEGLVGQSFIERDTIYLTAVPESFVKITSGLGEALPRNILVVALKYNDQVVGVIELASFKIFKDYEINFVEKLGEQIAATLVTANINERTRILLEASEKQADELRKKEEEMKQNYEELSAIQEDLSRNEKELILLKESLEDEVKRQTSKLELQKEEILKEQHRALQKENQVSAILNGTEAAIFLTSEEGNIIIVNEATSMMTGYTVAELNGMDFHAFLKVEKIRMCKPFRFPITQKDEKELQCEVLVNKIGIDGAKANLFFIVDITNIIKNENKFNAKIAELEAEVAKLKGE